MKRASWLIALLLTLPAAAQDPADTELSATQVAGSVWMIEGRGGNLGVSAGDDGVLLVDDQFAPVVPRIREALAKIHPEPVRFVLNTHWHGDHTGGNEAFGKAGAAIVAHHNVRERLSREQVGKIIERSVPPSPEDALPVLTFGDGVTFHWNDDTIEVVHVPHAHTDGDSIIHFKEANVLHLGDVFFNGLYPFIDVDSGGSIDGLIEAVDRALARTDSATKIIPGHGPLAGRPDLEAYRAMLAGARDAIAPLVAAGRTLDEVLAAKPTAGYDEKWTWSFISPERFVTLVYHSLAR